jgi:hypothetical protein
MIAILLAVDLKVPNKVECGVAIFTPFIETNHKKSHQDTTEQEIAG